MSIATTTAREHVFEVRLVDAGDLRGMVTMRQIERALTIGLAKLDAMGELPGRQLEEISVELMS